VALILVVWAVSTLVVLVVSLETLRPAVVMSMLVRPPRALLRVELLSLWQLSPWLHWVEVFWHLQTGMVQVTEPLSPQVTSVWCPALSLWGAGCFFQEGGGSLAAVEVDGSVIVPRSLVDDAPVSSNSSMTSGFSS